MPMQFRGNQVKDGEIDQAHHETLLSHVTRVDYSSVVSDNATTPPGGETAGDTFIIAGTGGDWSGFSTGNIVQALVDSPSSSADWVKLADALADGDIIRVATTGAGSFNGKDKQLGIYTLVTTSWTFLDPVDGFQIVELGSGASASSSLWYKDTMVWDEGNTSWVSVATFLSVSSGDNALEITNNEISHKDSVGHGIEPVDYAYVYSDEDYSGVTPTAADHANEVWIVNNWASPWNTDGEVVYATTNGWESVSGTGASDIISDGKRISTAPVVSGQATFNANRIAEYSGTFPSGSWTQFVPRDGDITLSEEDKGSTTNYPYNRVAAMWRTGVGWRPTAVWPGEFVGDYLSFDAKYDVNVNLKSDGGLQTGGSNDIEVGPTASATAISATNPVADKSYVDSLVSSGITWKPPVQVRMVRTDASGGGSPVSVNDYESAVVNTWGSGTYLGGATYANGDLAEYDGSRWLLILANSSGYVPSGTRMIITDTNGGGSFAGFEKQIATSDGAGSYDITGTGGEPAIQDGDAVLVVGDGAHWENNGFVADLDPSLAWVQFSGQQIYTGGSGIDITGQVVKVDLPGGASNPGLEYTAGGELDAKVGYTTKQTGNGIELNYYRINVDGGASGTTYHFTTITDGKAIEGSLMLFRNGQLLTKVSPGNEDFGKFSWNNSTNVVTFHVQDPLDTGEALDLFVLAQV